MKRFYFTFWLETPEKQKKILTLKITPGQWESEGIPNGYLFIKRNDFAIFVNEMYEVIEEKSSPDWKEWFEIYLSEGLLLQVYSKKYQIFLNLPEQIQ